MAQISTLATKLLANTSQYEKQMKKARGANKKTGASGAKMGAAFKKAAGPLIGFAASALSIGKAISTFKKTAAALDKLAKTSAKLGMSAQQLKQLEYSAQRAGISTDTFAMATQRMVRRVQEASLGTGEAVKALKDLGLNAQTLSMQGPGEQLRTIADAMKKIESPAERVRLAMKLFDSEGVAMVNMLSAGSAALAKQAARFDELFGSVSALDTAGIEQYSDAVLDMQTAWDGMSTQITVALAGPLGDLMAWLSKAPEGFRGLTMTIEDLTATFPRLAQAAINAAMPLGLGFLLPDIPAGARTAEEQVREEQLQRIKATEERFAKEKAASEARARQAKVNAERLAAEKAEKEAKRAADAQIRENERAAKAIENRVKTLTEKSLSELERYENQLEEIADLQEMFAETGGAAGLGPGVAKKLKKDIRIEVETNFDKAADVLEDAMKSQAADLSKALIPIEASWKRQAEERMQMQGRKSPDQKKIKLAQDQLQKLKEIRDAVRHMTQDAGGQGGAGGGGNINEVGI